MIDQEIIRQILERIRARFHPEKIILFGSYASGKATEESDLDVLIVAETNLPSNERFPAVCRLLADYPAAFDIIFKTPEEYERTRRVVNHIVYLADKYGRVVYERRNS